MPKGLAQALNTYFALPNTSPTERSAMAKARNRLFTDIKARINECPETVLDSGDKVRLRNVLERFIIQHNTALSKRYIKYLQKKRWHKLKVDMITFSNVATRHMIRMKVDVPGPFSCTDVLAQASAKFGNFFSKPSDGYLSYFVNMEYPIVPDSVIPMSEFIAKAKMVSYFKLMDVSREREAVWALLPELSLFNLSSKSNPSEVKAKASDTNSGVANSTFLTGRADMAIITFKDPIIPTAPIRDRPQRRAILEKFTTPNIPTYSTMRATAQEVSETKELNWEFLMLEAKRNDGALSRKMVTEGGQAYKGGEDNQEEEREVERALQVEPEGQGGSDGPIREGAGGGAEAERKAHGVNDDPEGGNVGGADSDIVTVREAQEEEETDPISAEDIDVGGAESYIQQCLGLRAFLPQIISQCLAVTSGPAALGPKIIKFVLSDGDNWLFGLVDCQKGSNGRICHTTAVSVIRHDNDHDGERVKRLVLNVMKLLTFWAAVPGRELLRLFPTKEPNA
ncbi:hypothetical protein P691DRAFT_774285 [Macrolepiota fuliginosa MF-IS2]|uniref:Uncharacterized protein n=1 Tax=Macrolepiota fuliginosa MF-IS2 TaxID=1400762 RepID=A0A9P5XI60_9AGAR|nr:hypothetical protein P691DRAFT_774285 [Macrolepiota fuliginosa MF-IS2]